MAVFSQQELDEFRSNAIRIQPKKQAPAPQVKGRGGSLTSFISEGGALGGAAAGAAAGSILGPVGTLVGGAIGGGIGAFSGRAAENKIRDDKWNLGEAGKEAAWTALFAGRPIKAIKGATAATKAVRAGEKALPAAEKVITTPGKYAPSTLLSKFKSGAEKTGEKMIASQGQITGAQARKFGIKPVETFGNINKRTGLTNLDDMTEVARGLTGAGDDSLLDTITRSAVKNTTGVQFTDDLQKIGEKLITEKGTIIPDAARKQLQKNIKNAKVAMYGGEGGSLSTLANPNEALNQANVFRSTAKQLTSGFDVKPENKQLAAVYNGLARNIEDALYKSPGVNDSIPVLMKAGADDLLFRAQDLKKAGNNAQAKAYEKIAQELRKVKSVDDLRSLKKDFVEIQKIDDATAQVIGARSLSGENISNKAGSVVRNPLNLLATPLDAATPKIGGMMAKFGTRGGKSVQDASAKGSAALSGAKRGASASLLSKFVDSSQPVEPPEIIDEESSYSPGLAGDIPPEDTTVSEDPNIQSGIDNAIQQALAAGDYKGLSALLSVAEYYDKRSGTGKDKELTANQETRAAAAQNALKDIPLIKEAISSGKLGGLKAVPGAGTSIGRRILGTEDLDAAMFNIADNILRARTGAAAPEAEVRRFMQSFLPSPTDSESAKTSKLERAVRELQGYVNPAAAASGY